MRTMRNTAIWAALGLWASGAAAADLALVVGVGSQRSDAIPALPDAADLADVRDPYRAAGFSLIRVRNPGAQGIDEALAEAGRRADAADRIVVVLAGRFVHGGGSAWLLPMDAGPLTPEAVAEDGLPLSVVLSWLAARPGSAVLALGTDDRSFDAGPFLSPGPGEIDAPQGVTVLTGSPRAIGRILQGAVLSEGTPLSPRLDADGEVVATGFLPRDWTLLPGDVAAPAAPAPDPTLSRRAAEDAYWQAVRDLDTEDAYAAYLTAYPDGRYRADARDAARRIVNAPLDRAQQAEAALNLARAERQQIQRDLSLLSYDTRGIDGIFGQGTRAAIRRWQGDQGMDETGFLDRDQIRRLAAMADTRAAELETEAERRRAETQAADQAYWQEVGEGRTEDALRAYLDQYPEGLYADLARSRLDEIEARNRDSAAERERIAWDQARRADTVASYRGYLRAWPDGTFTGEAEARLAQLQGVGAVGADAEAAAAEQALGLSAITRRAIEERLAALDYGPGQVDGQFDADTRRALRRYQADRNLPVTGYMNEATVVRVLADSVRSIFD